MPPKQIADIALKDEPGWITIGIDARYVYPSTGEVIDLKTRKILTSLKDETGAEVQSEKLLEVDWIGDKISHAGDQFGIGRKWRGNRATFPSAIRAFLDGLRYVPRLRKENCHYGKWKREERIDLASDHGDRGHHCTRGDRLGRDAAQ